MQNTIIEDRRETDCFIEIVLFISFAINKFSS